tara:strand:- start:2941 stop:4194 length:1254 start_codon:yes stop_codon:yes gene_type:complete
VNFKIKNDLNKSLYFLVFGLQALTILSNIFIYGYVSRVFGEEAFGEFSVYKRFFAFIFTFSTLGISVALPRQMIVQDEKKYFYFISSALILLIPCLILITIVFILKEYVTELIFNSLDYVILTELILISLPFYLYNILIVAYLRGIMKIFESNLLVTLTSLCYFITIFFSDSVHNLILINNICIFITTIIFHKLYIKFSFRRFTLKNINEPIKKLFSYGFPRIVGDVSLESFSTLPVLLMTKASGIVSAGYLSIGITFVKMIALIGSPLSNILLPVVSKKFKENNYKEIYSDLKKLLKIFVPFGLVSNIILYFGSGTIILIVLGPQSSEAEYIIKFISFVSAPILIFNLFRSINDAIYHYAINSVICFLSLIIFYLLYLLLSISLYDITDSILISFVCSYFCMAIFSFYFFKQKKIS